MRIDSGGNLLVGKTSTDYGNSNRKEFNLYGNQESIITLDTGNALPFFVNNNQGIAELINQNNNVMRFGTNNTERMRIDASGNLLVNTTSGSAKIVAEASPTGTVYLGKWASSGGTALYLEVGGSAVGSIGCTASTTSYNPSSDARLKENIRDYDNALADVMKLKPRKYSWKADGAEDNGFIAQELLETPEFSNRVNPIGDGADPMYGVDYMKFVAVLTGAIQEQQAMIEDLKSRLSAVEAN